MNIFNIFMKAKIKLIFLAAIPLIIGTRPALGQIDPTPIAYAGEDRIEILGQQVTLFNESSSPEGRTLQYEWSIVSRPMGSTTPLINPRSKNPSFFADREGTFVIRLRASDGILTSPHDDVIVNIIPNRRPIVIVNEVQSVQPGQTVTLDASSSFDLDGEELQFNWVVETAPEGSNFFIFRPHRAQTSFIPDIEGSYLLRVFVRDSVFSSDAYLSVSASGTRLIPPVANAGTDIFVNSGEVVFLDGSGSSDAGNLPLSYIWAIEQVPEGSTAVIENPESSTPTFIPDINGEYRLSLQVNNQTLMSVPNFIRITAQQQPIANIQSRNIAIGTAKTILLNASESLGLPGEELSYQWALARRPSGSMASLTNSTSVLASLTTDIAGVYTVSLIVRGEDMGSYEVQRNIIVGGTREQQVVRGSTVTLNKTPFDDFEINWDIITRPMGSRANILNSQDLTGTFVADVEGTYIIRWRFTEGQESTEDYSLVHAYPTGGSIVFGPQTIQPESSDQDALFTWECSDFSWDFNILDTTKDYVLTVAYNNIDGGFILLNGEEIVNRYDFSSSGTTFSKGIMPLAANTLKTSCTGNDSTSSSMTIQVREMALSGTENAPPTLQIGPLEVVQGEIVIGQVNVIDLGSTRHSYSILKRPVYGVVQIDTNGELSYTAFSDYEGNDAVVVKVENDNALAGIIEVPITVTRSQ